MTALFSNRALAESIDYYYDNEVVRRQSLASPGDYEVPKMVDKNICWQGQNLAPPNLLQNIV